ncbi:cytochrome P450 [Streptomyces sp. NPDC056956]|uniref:cytochrome P450 n=1 Tax=Streptomyces sp. NPDC056956 TaxID=3345980 RepID=UPI0036452F68
MTSMQEETRPVGRCPVAHGFDAMGDDYYRDPAAHLAAVRDASPVFWYPHLNAWIVTRREDCLTVLSDWQTYSSAANSAADVPEKHRAVYPPDLVSKMIVGQDPPGHTETRSVAQRGFIKERMDRLQPEIEARAHRIIDRFENNGSANLLEEYSLELTTQTIMALLGLGYEHEAMLRQLRDDLFAVLSSAHEPLPEPARTEVWDRFVEANLKLRAIVEERRDSTADDIISVMASARARDGSYALPTPQIALHVSEFAAAGTDTTAQAMTNAVIFLSQNPQALQDALAEPELWPRVFEETVRRRPSSTFTSRRVTRDVELSGVRISAGDMVWVALASANTDPDHVDRPFEFDIHRPDPTDHLAFTAGRHTCLGNPRPGPGRHGTAGAVRAAAVAAPGRHGRAGLPAHGAAAGAPLAPGALGRRGCRAVPDADRAHPQPGGHRAHRGVRRCRRPEPEPSGRRGPAAVEGRGARRRACAERGR